MWSLIPATFGGYLKILETLYNRGAKDGSRTYLQNNYAFPKFNMFVDNCVKRYRMVLNQAMKPPRHIVVEEDMVQLWREVQWD